MKRYALELGCSLYLAEEGRYITFSDHEKEIAENKKVIDAQREEIERLKFKITKWEEYQSNNLCQDGQIIHIKNGCIQKLESRINTMEEALKDAQIIVSAERNNKDSEAAKYAKMVSKTIQEALSNEENERAK